MREVHIIKGPIWNGQPDSPKFLSVAHFRLVDSKDIPHKGSILIWSDYKIRDKNSTNPNAMVLMWKYPFKIKCADAVKYPESFVGEGFRRTKVHTIPVNDMKIYITRRKRTMTQDDFNSLKMASLAVKQNK
jgi:hypothetical protein